MFYAKQEKPEQKLKFQDVFKTLNGFAFKSKQYTTNGSYKVITIKNITDDGFSGENSSKINIDTKCSRYILRKGEIVMTMTGNIGRIGVVDIDKCLLNQRVIKIESFSQAYTWSYLKINQKRIENLGKGTAQKNLSLQELNDLPVCNSIEEIARYKRFDPLYEDMASLLFIKAKLSETKSLLLNRFFGSIS